MKLATLTQSATNVFTELPVSVPTPKSATLIVTSTANTARTLIVFGSSAVAERAVAYGGGLFGRRTAQMRLGPLTPRYTAYFLPTYGASELAVAYAVSNGVPHYLALFNGGRGLEENLAFLFSRWGPLYEEAENLLRHEVREPHVYLNIVRAVEEGAATYSEIADKARISPQTLAKYLHVLEKLEVVRREVPVLGKARPIYVVSDLYIKFWTRFVYPQRDWIELGNTPRVDLNSYMASAYEQVVLPLDFPTYLAVQSAQSMEPAVIKELFEEYLETGGFPKSINRHPDAAEALLDSVVSETYRHGKSPQLLKDLAAAVVERVPSPLSYHSLAQEIGVSHNTVREYLEFLSDIT